MNEPTASTVHVGLACRSETAVARFYGELLGLERASAKTLSAALALPLFGIDAELPVVNYVGPAAHFEIFLWEDVPPADRGAIHHVCLEVVDPEALAERARSQGFDVVRVPRGDRWVTFIADADGNRFELKLAPRRGIPR